MLKGGTALSGPVALPHLRIIRRGLDTGPGSVVYGLKDGIDVRNGPARYTVCTLSRTPIGRNAEDIDAWSEKERKREQETARQHAFGRASFGVACRRGSVRSREQLVCLPCYLYEIASRVRGRAEVGAFRLSSFYRRDQRVYNTISVYSQLTVPCTSRSRFVFLDRRSRDQSFPVGRPLHPRFGRLAPSPKSLTWTRI